jgi:hypothetical protein
VRVFIVALILVTAIVVNVVINVRFNEISDTFPFIGVAVWVALLVCVPLRRPAWGELPGAIRGSIFLLSLVLAASMMPVHKLPDASWRVALGLGFVSAVFDNIPLTALALQQGGYDWGYLGRLRRLDDLVRLIGGRRIVEHVPRRQGRDSLGPKWMARGDRLRDRVFCDARRAELVSAAETPGAGASAASRDDARGKLVLTHASIRKWQGAKRPATSYAAPRDAGQTASRSILDR